MGARFRVAVAAAALVAASGVAGVHAEEGATLGSLRLAVQRETSAQWCYEAYAMQARREGQPRAANLFRAMALGEAVHAVRHQAELERLGGAFEPVIESVVVRSTAENLAAAVAGERSERESVYRQFADFARRECLYEALAAFNYARGAEATHLALFATELGRLQEASPEQQLLACAFYDPLVALATSIPNAATFVCSGCGSAFASKPERSCGLCGTAGEEFFVVR